MTAAGLVVAGVAAGFAKVGGGDVSHLVGLEALGEAAVLEGTGCSPRLDCSDRVLERWVLAVWLGRVMGVAADSAAEADGFVDVNSDAWWRPHVQAVANLAIITPCSPDRFCPQQPVTRGEMATSLAAAFALDPGPSGRFGDVTGRVHQPAVDALAGAGVTTGCGAGRFCPHQAATLGQAATLLHRLIARHVPPVGWGRVSADVPDVALTDARTGHLVNLRSVIEGNKPTMLWFLSPL